MRKEIDRLSIIKDDERPHLSLGGYRELELDRYFTMMEQYFASRSSLAINFQSIGAFMTFPALFLSPVMTKELMQFHFRYYEHFKRFSYAANKYYMPGSWVPHCTIISHVPMDCVSEAAALCLNKYKPFSGALTEVALVREGGPLLHSVTLKDP